LRSQSATSTADTAIAPTPARPTLRSERSSAAVVAGGDSASAPRTSAASFERISSATAVEP
jgi:hypothetical protein